MHWNGVAGSKLTCNLGLCCSPMPHGPIGIAHTILYNWTLRVMTLFKGLCTGWCFTKMDATLYQIKLIITIFNLY